MGEEVKVYRVLVGKPKGKRPLERPRRRWVDEIRMDLREMGCGRGVEWIQLAQDTDRWRAVVNTMMNERVLALWSWLVRFIIFFQEKCLKCGTLDVPVILDGQFSGTFVLLLSRLFHVQSSLRLSRHSRNDYD
jgi:hypothetical protein